MVADKLCNSGLYYGLSDGIKKGFEYLKTTDISNLEPGRYEIDGDNVFVLIQEYNTKPPEDCKWESHKKYIDIQYIFSGRELMGYAPIEFLTDTVDHTPAKDTLNYKDGNKQGGYVQLEKDMFALFFPADGHQPNVINGSSCANKKAVVKIKVDN